MVASWVSQVSYSPPLVLSAVRHNRAMNSIIPAAGLFGLNILQDHQMDLLPNIKSSPPQESPDWMDGRTSSGIPLLKDALAYLELKLEESHTPGDHTLFIGKILDGRVLQYGDPLTTLDYPGVYLGNR